MIKVRGFFSHNDLQTHLQIWVTPLKIRPDFFSLTEFPQGVRNFFLQQLKNEFVPNRVNFFHAFQEILRK